jgi:uncharacterized protein (TIGR02246 family)
MKQIFAIMLALASLVGVSWAGPVEEVTQTNAPRLQAFQQGNVEAYTAAYADNAVFQSSFSLFRVEGKDAIRTFFAQLFQMYPKRNVYIRQPMTRVYGDDLVIQNNYAALYVTNERGEVKTYDTRSNTVWKKIDGRWQIVDQHISRLPSTQ